MAETINVSATATPFQDVAGVECFVDIYPFESSAYSFTGEQIISLTMQKSLKASDPGQFSLVLAPAMIGPNLTAAQIITPMSFVVIGMRRGNKSAITMLGLVTVVSEPQVWATEKSVQRVIVISGYDISYYYSMADYYTLWIAGSLETDHLGQNASGLLSGSPDSIGKDWYDTIMAAEFFKDTFVPYKGSKVTFQDMMGTRFDAFDVFVPYGDYYLGINDSWNSKYRRIFPFPFYEFFVATNFNQNYTGVSGGTSFTCAGLGDTVTSTPAMVARLNPVPRLVASSKDNTPSFNSLDMDDWNGLQEFDLEGVGFIRSTPSFTEAEVYNFYALNPTWMTGQIGGSNSNIVQYLYNYAAVFDQASIARYGYRPMTVPLDWLSDPAGIAAQKQPAIDFPTLIGIVMGQLCGYFEPTPLMMNSQVITWLRPDIAPGCRFTYEPYKDGVKWTFYIEAVSHSYTFGGESTTTLVLSRGLPSSIYADPSPSGVLFNLHIGNAKRVDGVYSVGLPAGSPPGLKGISPSQFADWMLTLHQRYVTPQSVTSP